MIRSGIVISLIFFFCFSLNVATHAQESQREVGSFDFRGESLSEALDIIMLKMDINLMYDPEITEGIDIYERITTENMDELLTKLLEKTNLDYIILSSGTYVIVKSTRTGPFYGTFTGKVVDSETGEPLPGATVFLVDASGGTSTNKWGNFSINKLVSGTHSITFSYVGYKPVFKTIEIEPDSKLTEQIFLDPKPVDVLPVFVKAHRAKIPFHENSSIPSDSEWNSVGTMGDAIRNLNLISGIQYGLPLTNLHLQGGQQSEHRILLDGVPVYNPHSFGQMFSSFSPYAIGSVRVHKAGYGVQAGSQIAGLINMMHDTPAKENNSILIQADPLSANIRGDLTLDTGSESSLQIMSSLRTNFWNIYKNPTLEQTLSNWNNIDPLITNSLHENDFDAKNYASVRQNSDIKFFDYHLASTYKIDNFSSISASIYLAENKIGTKLLNQYNGPSASSSVPYLFANDHYQWSNLTSQLSWSEIVTPRLDITTQASLSINHFQHQSDLITSDVPIPVDSRSSEQLNSEDELFGGSRAIPIQFDGNEIQHFTFKTDGSYSISPQLSLEGGVQLDRVQSGIEISNSSYFPANIDQSSTLFSNYLNTKYSFGNYWNIEGGSRFTYSVLSGRFFAEPRFSVQFDQPESELGYWSAKLSGGLYRQYVNEFQITNSGPTSVVPAFSIWSLSDKDNIPKAWHLNGSTLLEPTSNSTVRMEVYYKWQPITNITSYTSLSSNESQNQSNTQLSGIRAFAETTEMKAWGAGISLDQNISGPRLKIKAGYDFSHSWINMDTQFGRKIQAPWNEPHRTQLRLIWRVIPDLAITTKWQGIWGRSWAFRQSYYNYLRYQSVDIPSQFSFDNPENDRLNPFQQVDVSFIYQPSINAADLEIRLELLNVLNRENTLEKYLQPVPDGENTTYRIRNRNLPGFYPTVSVQVTF